MVRGEETSNQKHRFRPISGFLGKSYPTARKEKERTFIALPKSFPHKSLLLSLQKFQVFNENKIRSIEVEGSHYLTAYGSMHARNRATYFMGFQENVGSHKTVRAVG